MRISTGMIYNSGVSSMQQRTSSLLRTQQQISSGRRMLTPSDDPVAAARSLEIQQSQSVNKQYQAAQDNAKSMLGVMDSQLSSINDLLTRVRELTVQGGNAALSAVDRRSIATELRARFDEMVGLANSTDGTGQYLFSGYQSISKPFAGSVDNGVVYQGDDGVRTLQISGGRHLPISNSGNDIFMRIKSGNGVFATGIQSEKPANARHVTYEGTSTITNPPPTTGDFEMRFWTDTAGTVTTSAQVVGTVDLNSILPLTFTNGTDNLIEISIDGGGPISVDLDTLGTGTTYNSADEIVSAIQTAVGNAATVSIDTAGQLVITNASTGALSAIAVADDGGAGNDSAAALFGGPLIANGVDGAAGTTYFDLVDATTKTSLFTNTASTTGGARNTYTHVYTGGAPLNLSSAGPYAFDYGMSAVFTGVPADGDTFTVNRTAAGVTFTGKTFTVNAARAVIDDGVVTSEAKWKQAANSGDLEVRFWVDTQGSVDTSGQAMGSTVIPPGITVAAGTADQFRMYVDGGGVQTVTVPAGTYATPEDLLTAINGAMPAGSSIAFDAGYHLVVTSSSTGSTSTIALDNGVGVRDGLARFFGATQAYTPGVTGTIGTTYYDLVDVSNGRSLYSGAPSATGATYTHAYSDVHATVTGTVDLSGGFTSTAGVNNTLNLTINGVARSIAIPAGAYTFAQLQTQLQKQLGPFGVTVDANGNNLALSSDTINANYAVTVTGGNGADDLFGAVLPAPSLQPVNSATIALKGTEATPFDYGASVTITGIPAGGDAFTIKNNTDSVLGNGYFVTGAKTQEQPNMGSGIIGTGEVADPTKWDSASNSRQLEVRFWKDPEDVRANAPVYYDLVDAETERSLFTDTISTSGGSGNTYTHVFKSGDAIPFSNLAAPYVDFGVSVTINGTPVSGDVFTLNNSTTESIFDTLGRLIHAIEGPVGPIGSNTNAELQNKLGTALTSIASATDNFLRVRADIGTRMGEVDDLSSVSSNIELQHSAALSNLQDVDYSKAITDLMRTQMELQAAQQSFTKVSQLSLFSYI